MAKRGSGDNKTRSGNVENETGKPDPITDGGSGEQTGDDSIPVIDPATVAASGDEPAAKRGRGRPPGSTKSKQKTTTPTDLTGLLMSIHMMGSVMLKTPELTLNDAEAKQLSDALGRINELYGAPVMTPEQEAWGRLLMAAITVYCPRFIAIKNRVREEKIKRDGGVTIEGSYAAPPTKPN